jgi:hypothetical protein
MSPNDARSAQLSLNDPTRRFTMAMDPAVPSG